MALPSAGLAAAILSVGCGVIGRWTIAETLGNRVAKMRRFCHDLALGSVVRQKIGIWNHEAG
ncbi:hypothetical protein [Mesorhizobium australafricanum]|uniref:Uncharacterized protein n=1 Tax=Mesorhizobium australafricanum TaxID=3072311 RepID=A0ABU4X1P9_9HYPH|nr:hypothetical protein [Mesorhizobium sp. VK3E]MDX8442246.1 hypothetical protein [Mesorhizobium sp. VK3E]